LEKFFLVVLGSEVVMGASLLNNISTQFPLGEQGIGSDGFAGDIDTVEKRDGGFDFVGLFFFVASFYWQGSDFFWV